MLTFMWLEIGEFGTGGADTLDFPLMAMSMFHMERSNHLVYLALET